MSSFQDKTSANDKSVGFDYQYYYFLYLLLGLEEGESIGLEVKDDVHIDLNDGRQILIQLKHTIQNNAQGIPINITQMDKDIWKTIYTWTNIINDPIEGRNTQAKQFEFIKKTNFVLVTNKSSNAQNILLSKIIEFKSGKLKVQGLYDYIEQLGSTSLDEKIKKYIQLLLLQKKEWLSKFFNNFNFNLDEDDLVEKIKSKIRTKYVKNEKIDYVFSMLDSKLREKNYINTKKAQKILISFEDVYQEFRTVFEAGQDNSLPRINKEIEINVPLKEQVFIKQLIDMYLLSPDNQKQMLEYTTAMMESHNNFEYWHKQGLITRDQINKFHANSVETWKIIHEEAHQDFIIQLNKGDSNLNESELEKAAATCFNQTRKKILEFEKHSLDTAMSNGQYYFLSNIPKIGWHLRWKEKYIIERGVKND
ncbi:ABC-three component system protein [Paenibacillus hunanensis]|uniref:ABC-three component systems C-terminal domain-containing protein n=1 Tax=Paenibacillus hunanensis TaxID=539262 RepID=A0ABU1IXL3_9BACL|nr:ABC-three component system protein [Paenibacillus hunanensis]MDR6242963.1 hypothetical protein [Paenibacillus hunanensis]GGJ13051.1 hypothetical protein GCM10008022_22670 [Paenibacillus hunanensis]